mgnify:CR=1 FL=1|jgi:hypothetical protein
MKESKFWLKDIMVKEGVSEKEVVSKLIEEIGGELLLEMLSKKYKELVIKNNN